VRGERGRDRHREVVGDPGVLRLGHAHRRHAEAEETSVYFGQFGIVTGDIEDILDQHLAELRIVHFGRTAADRDDRLDVRVQQALPDHTLADHAGRAENEHLHARLLPSG
jgi:hypothetical protein